MNNLNQFRTLAARLSAAALLLASAGSALAEVRYVDVNSTNATLPYISWATAATNIQDAVDAAVAGDEIVVTNGIYATGGRAVSGSTNRVAVEKPLRLRSINGPQFTTIHGGYSVRCVYLTNGASLSGFTLTRGSAWYGAGLWCESTNAMASNCVVSGNATVGQISPPCPGLGCDFAVLSSASLGAAGDGGGAFGGTLNNCTLSGNRAFFGGGADGCVLNNCTLAGNVSTGGPRNGVDFSPSGGGANRCALNNCTLTGNSGGGAWDCTLNNCIVYYNTNGANYSSYFSTLNYSCTTPLPTNGVGNITNEPAFVNFAAGNYRLRPDSPCIDAGTNLSAGISNDLDGRPRPLDGNGDGLAAFDMGAYEYRTPLLVWQDSPSPSWPHADWATAAHTIQDAVDAALAGDEIVVTNGIYNPVVVDKALNVRSVSGPQFTTIDGGHSTRCVYLTNDASLSGFTLTNGAAKYGGGLFCDSTDAVASNCVLSGNVTMSVPFDSNAGGGAYGGTLDNCTLTGNSANGGKNTSGAGGGACNATLNHCTLSGNSANDGGGAAGCILNNCRLTGNSAGGEVAGGGGASGCTLNNCTLSGNRAVVFFGPSDAYGGGAFVSTLNNCTLTSNSADFGGGANGCALNNCTLTDNSALFSDAGGGAAECILNNCIAYLNTAPGAANYDSYSTLNYSCTTPQPTNGIGNITNAPLFVDLASGNLRLQSNSPCINAGLNAFAPAGPDLDGNPRIVGGTVDIGAYEYQSLDLLSFGVVSNQFGFNITGQSNWVIVLEASSDFTTWTPLTTNTLGGSPFPFRDPTAPNLPQRFYRARQALP